VDVLAVLVINGQMQVTTTLVLMLCAWRNLEGTLVVLEPALVKMVTSGQYRITLVFSLDVMLVVLVSGQQLGMVIRVKLLPDPAM